MRACERFGVLPPGVKRSWDECGLQARKDMLNYDEIASYDESNFRAQLAGLQI